MLKDLFIKLKQKTNSITINPLLNCFEQDDLERIDNKALIDSFVAEKQKKILNLLKMSNIDFNPKLKSSYDEYSEALTYIQLKEKFTNVDRVSEGNDKVPDFKIEFSCNNNGETQNNIIYAELKSMAFSDGNLNYIKAMEQGLEMEIDIESQLKQGKMVAFGVTEIQPLHRGNKNYNPTSIRNAIEILIEKIEQNIKEGQFSLGDTVLIVDLKQLPLPSYYIEGAVPFFQEKMNNSLMSGIQWNVAFGKIGHLILKPIEFEGKENIDGELEREGILVNRNYIKAIVFLDYLLNDNEPKIIGLYSQRNVNDSVLEFLYRFCHFVNDEKNSNGWKLYETTN